MLVNVLYSELSLLQLNVFRDRIASRELRVAVYYLTVKACSVRPVYMGTLSEMELVPELCTYSLDQTSLKLWYTIPIAVQIGLL